MVIGWVVCGRRENFHYTEWAFTPEVVKFTMRSGWGESTRILGRDLLCGRHWVDCACRRISFVCYERFVDVVVFLIPSFRHNRSSGALLVATFLLGGDSHLATYEHLEWENTGWCADCSSIYGILCHWTLNLTVFIRPPQFIPPLKWGRSVNAATSADDSPRFSPSLLSPLPREG